MTRESLEGGVTQDYDTVLKSSQEEKEAAAQSVQRCSKECVVCAEVKIGGGGDKYS